MNMLQRCIAVFLMAVCLLPMKNGTAELAPERADFYRARTEEWEHALGDYVHWHYYDRALFCAIYGRRPGDFSILSMFRRISPNFRRQNASPMKKRSGSQKPSCPIMSPALQKPI